MLVWVQVCASSYVFWCVCVNIFSYICDEWQLLVHNKHTYIRCALCKTMYVSFTHFSSVFFFAVSFLSHFFTLARYVCIYSYLLFVSVVNFFVRKYIITIKRMACTDGLLLTGSIIIVIIAYWNINMHNMHRRAWMCVRDCEK